MNLFISEIKKKEGKHKLSKLEGYNAKNKKINTINFNDFIDNDLRVAIELAKDTKINSIEDIKALTGYLDLSMMNTVINLTSLRGLEFAINIEQLYLTETGISNINEISSLNNLKWLEVNNNNITDINPVANLINLQGLNISNNPINKMVSLNKLKNLKVLRMRNISNNLSAENLKELSLYTLNNIETLDLGDNALKDIVDESGNSLMV